MRYILSEISEAINGKAKLNDDLVISNVFIDSRTAHTSEKSLFFAINGKNNNGHNYLSDLLERGVKNFVVDDYKASPKTKMLIIL